MWQIAIAVVGQDEDVALGGTRLHGPVDEVGQRVCTGYVAVLRAIDVFGV